MLLCMTGSLNLTQAGTDNPPVKEETGYAAGALYVKFSSNILPPVKSANREYPVSFLFLEKSAQNAYGIRPVAYSLHLFNTDALDNTFRIEFDSVHKADQLVKSLQNDPRVVFVEKVPVHNILQKDIRNTEKNEKPNDCFFGNIDDVHTSWNLEMVGYPEIYGHYQGSKNVKVAIVDNAVWGDHEDLQIDHDLLYDAVSGFPGKATPPKWVDQNQQGSAVSPSEAYGWSHGTHCAGVVGAITNNGKGIASIASGVTLMGVKVSETSSRELIRTVQGVLWAVDNGAQVVSMSYGSTYYSSVEESVYKNLALQGVVLIAAAGNDGKKDEPNYPGAYQGVISVGSLNSDGQRSDFSNYGDWVDVWAPGGYYVKDGVVQADEMILSSTYCISQFFPNKESFANKYYDVMAGTSMATPLVSSAAALLLSYYPGLTGYEIKEILQNSTQNNSIYLPLMFSLMESHESRKVENLEAYFDSTQNQCSVSWKAPQEPGVVSYTIYHNGEIIQENVSETHISFNMDKPEGFVGVEAIYEETKTIPEYTEIQNGTGTKIEVPQGNTHQEKVLAVCEDGVLRIIGEHDGMVEIFNLQGQRMIPSVDVNSSINVSHLSQGIYIGRLIQDNNVRSFKFVRK